MNEIELELNDKHWSLIKEKNLDYHHQRRLFFEWHEDKKKVRKNYNLAFLNWLKKAAPKPPYKKKLSQSKIVDDIITKLKSGGWNE